MVEAFIAQILRSGALATKITGNTERRVSAHVFIESFSVHVFGQVGLTGIRDIVPVPVCSAHGALSFSKALFAIEIGGEGFCGNSSSVSFFDPICGSKFIDYFINPVLIPLGRVTLGTHEFPF